MSQKSDFWDLWEVVARPSPGAVVGRQFSHICPVCSCRTPPCCPRCFPTFNNPVSPFSNLPLYPEAPDLNKVPPRSHSGRTSPKLPRRPGPAASWLLCQQGSLHTTTPEPGPNSCVFRNWSCDGKGVASRAANDPPMICHECANNGLNAPEDNSGRNLEPLRNGKSEPEPDDNATGPYDDTSDFQRRDDRATTLTKESQLSKGYSALLDEPLAP